ncbi:galactoside alpha-(1,2)-fucosyltransferase 2 [Cherax quadricarinatus]|uniref:galactoside alpha-(1,2)-fucosyltransferase 2 n=1 Tax=Cherax quadricarinatus TaxID=27406 RepID=UPI00387E94B1
MVFDTVGRLGNCLNSYATALIFSADWGRFPLTVAVTQHVFKGVSTLLARQHLPLPVVSHELLMDVYDVGEVERVDPDYFKNDMMSHLEPTFRRAISEHLVDGQEKLYLLPGYPNPLRKLANHHSVIRSVFKIRPVLQARALSFLNRVRAANRGNITFVGVHIRRKDYVSFAKTFYRCKLPGPGYYLRAIQHYRATLTNPVFVVCSDDLPSVRIHLQNATDVVISDQKHPEEDLALLASCTHSVMTVGSFGFWASYLAGGRVVYPLIKNCSHSPFVSPGTLGPRGYPNWLALPV